MTNLTPQEAHLRAVEAALMGLIRHDQIEQYTHHLLKSHFDK